MAGHSPSKTGVNALVPGHPRLTVRPRSKEDVDARHKAGHDEVSAARSSGTTMATTRSALIPALGRWKVLA